MKKTLGILSLSLFLGACGQPAAPAPATNTTTGTNKPAPAESARAQLERMMKEMVEQSQATPTEWIVELKSDPTEAALSRVMQEQASFKRGLAQLQRSGEVEKDLAVTEEFSQLFNGFAVKATAADALKIAEQEGVLAVWPSVEIERPEVQYVESTPDMRYALGITGVANAQDFGFTGKGVKVGIIDSGVDVDHPAFKGRIVKQWDFVGDDPTAGFKPDPIADDCGGHGSHVAGIVGGSDATTGFKGVAPDVEFGAYRVFGCKGGGNSAIIMKAMERAYTDGMDVINMSLGAALQWPEYPTARMASRLSKKGIPLVISAGNEGTRYGQFSMGAPSVAPEAISVAAVENTMSPLSSALLNTAGAEKNIGYMHASGAAEVPVGTTVILASDPNNAEGCGPFADGLFNGKAAVISRGSCAFAEKVKNAVAAGATAVLIHNNVPGYMGIGGLEKVTVPVGLISKEDGEAIRAALAAGQAVSFTYKDPAETNDVAVPGARSITNFSSYGLTPDLNLKPEVAAPGGNIYSAAPLDKEPKGYVVMGGTSMSAPHVTGVVALMIDAAKTLEPGVKLTPLQIKTRLMNSAVPQVRYENHQYSDDLDHVQLQGAGLVNALGAVLAKDLVALPNKLNLGATSVSSVHTRRITLHNNGAQEATYKVYHQPALTVAGTVAKPQSERSFATATMNGESIDGEDNAKVITIPAGESKEITVTINAPAGASEYGQYGGWIVADGLLKRAVVPYAGFIGDYQKESIFYKDIFNHEGKLLFNGPVFNGSEKLVFAQGAENKEVELDEKNKANVWLFFSRPTPKFDLTLTNLNSNESKLVSESSFIGRAGSNVWDTSTPLKMRQTRPFQDIGWDAKCISRTAPADGYKCIKAARTDASGNLIKYQLTARALKPLGDENNPAHWEVYKSPVFTLNASIDKP